MVKKVKKKRGRPLKYTPEFINNLRLKLEKWIEIPSNWYISQFAIEHKIWKQRIYDFANKDPKFKDSLKKAEQIQETRLVQLALARKVDTSMAIFTLKNIAGWRNEPPIRIEQSQHYHQATVNFSEKSEDDLINILLGRDNGRFKADSYSKSTDQGELREVSKQTRGST